ncbi:MAG: flippase-like domain-containing protein [Alphaproteobacteria bacterium]|nr:flippase-like domain-containing protein [Alphaproteobacteria bacterium]
MRLIAWVAFALGAALLAVIIAATDLGRLWQALGLVGWGVLLIVAARLVVHVIDALSWHVLLEPSTRPVFGRLVWMWVVGDAINALLPVAQVGGELARARLLTRAGVAGPVAAASLVVGITLSVLTLILFAGLGAILLLGSTGKQGAMTALGVVFGMTALGGLLAGFYLAQRRGLFLKLAQMVKRIAGGREWLALAGGGAALDSAVNALYRRPRAVLHCGVWRFVGWVAGALEIWVALGLLGQTPLVTDALVIESLGQAVKSFGFAIPGSLGVQEGGILLMGTAVGLTAEVAIAIALLRRLRDVILGVPVLMLWQWQEAARLARARRGGVTIPAGDKSGPSL